MREEHTTTKTLPGTDSRLKMLQLTGTESGTQHIAKNNVNLTGLQQQK